MWRSRPAATEPGCAIGLRALPRPFPPASSTAARRSARLPSSPLTGAAQRSIRPCSSFPVLRGASTRMSVISAAPHRSRRIRSGQHQLDRRDRKYPRRQWRRRALGRWPLPTVRQRGAGLHDPEPDPDLPRRAGSGLPQLVRPRPAHRNDALGEPKRFRRRAEPGEQARRDVSRRPRRHLGDHGRQRRRWRLRGHLRHRQRLGLRRQLPRRVPAHDRLDGGR